MRPVLILPLLIACGKNKDTSETGDVHTPVDEPGWVATLSLAATAAEAGEGVAYTLTVTDPAGVEQDPTRWVLTSDQEADLLWSPATLTPTIAASHALTATIAVLDEDGAELELVATAAVSVSPTDAYDLDLMLSDAAADAGDELSWSIAAVDRFGNTVDATSAEMAVDSSDVTVESGTLWSHVPGTYLATASMGALEDVELFVVTPGDPVSVSLDFNTDVERYETVTAGIEIRDAYDNLTDDDWTLTIDGDGATSQSYRNVTFFDEGWYTVTVTVDGTALSDSAGPFLIDSSGPILNIETPTRGDWIEGSTVRVSGTVTDDWSSTVQLTVDGAAVTPASDGGFSTTLSADPGIRVISTSAQDDDGNSSTDIRAALVGDFLPYGDPLLDGIQVRLHEGSGGFDTLEALGEDLVSGTDLSALIPSPVFSDSSTNTYDPCFGLFGGCEVTVTWYSVNLYASNPSIGDTPIDIDPRSDGTLRVTATIEDPSLDWSASGTVTGVSYSGSGDITADDITVVMSVTPSVRSDGSIDLAINSVTASSTNFDFDLNGFSWLESVASFFGFDIDGTIEDYMVDAIEDAVYDAVPPLLEDALQDLELSFDLDIQDNTYTIEAIPESIDVDSTGLTLSLETMVEPSRWVRSEYGLGSLYVDYSTPAWTGSPGSIIAISDDFLNQVLYALWGGGLLDLSVDSTELGLDPADLAFLIGDVESLMVTVDPLLPPVVVPGSSGNLADLQLGDLYLALTADGTSFIEVYVSAVTDLDVSVDGDATLSASVGSDMALYFDVVYPDASSVGAADTEALLSALVPLLLPTLTDALGEIEIPSIQGFTLSGVSVSTAGAEDGYLQLGGNLTED